MLGVIRHGWTLQAVAEGALIGAGSVSECTRSAVDGDGATSTGGLDTLTALVPCTPRLQFGRDCNRAGATLTVVTAGFHMLTALVPCTPRLQFGKVYKGTWHGTTVAIKCLVLPASMSRSTRWVLAPWEGFLNSRLRAYLFLPFFLSFWA